MLLLDPAWNPATEDQCFDRIHRLGQTEDVVVTRFIMKDRSAAVQLDYEHMLTLTHLPQHRGENDGDPGQETKVDRWRLPAERLPTSPTENSGHPRHLRAVKVFTLEG